MEYTGDYPLYVGPGQYNVNPKADPSVLTPIENGMVSANYRYINVDNVNINVFITLAEILLQGKVEISLVLPAWLSCEMCTPGPNQVCRLFSAVWMMHALVTAGPPVAQGGSWKVVGNSGAVAIHALPFTNEIMLLLSRPTNFAGGGDASLTNFLTVCFSPQNPIILFISKQVIQALGKCACSTSLVAYV